MRIAIGTKKERFDNKRGNMMLVAEPRNVMNMKV
jgi:hypothetical protein